ncbi:NADH dehydrogenase subunit 6 [Iris pallida]|uniref:NADH dehydrogenase subunit 6 (Plastid) n=1 Tax=Iris pallida TaxID=29817 RepID=A0AAX6IGZ3_IRIPA|nr:NADH dehydrogenase subunit 6 [Iris pallida]
MNNKSIDSIDWNRAVIEKKRVLALDLTKIKPLTFFILEYIILRILGILNPKYLLLMDHSNCTYQRN